jgi:hypothetical protein
LERCAVVRDRTSLRAVADADLATTEAEVARIDADDAEVRWERAAQQWEQLGDPFRTAYARYRLAETMCVHRGGRARASAIAGQARRTAVDLGARRGGRVGRRGRCGEMV